MPASQPSSETLLSMQRRQTEAPPELTRQITDTQLSMLRSGVALAGAVQAGWGQYAASAVQARRCGRRRSAAPKR